MTDIEQMYIPLKDDGSPDFRLLEADWAMCQTSVSLAAIFEALHNHGSNEATKRCQKLHDVSVKAYRGHALDEAARVAERVATDNDHKSCSAKTVGFAIKRYILELKEETHGA